MKILMKLLYVVPLVGIVLASCTKVEKIELESNGGYNTMENEESEAYYAKLRAYKATAENYARPVAFGWFSDWSPVGLNRRGYLTSMPDSMDIVSMWSGAPGRYEITPEQKQDKEFVQKVKGTKLLEVSLISHIGKGRTPESVYADIYKQAEEEQWSQAQIDEAKKLARWDFWGFTSHDLSNRKNLDEAIANYAKALCDSLYTGDWDGYDIDWELGSGTNDHDGSIDQTGIKVLIREMGKYIGPKSDPDNKGHKLLVVDGNIEGLTSELDEYVDYWIKQAYGQSNPTLYYSGTVPEKVIVTENFELYYQSGGQLLNQAAIMPESGHKGGVGAYRFQRDYDNVPDYKWMHQAIRINQKVFNERQSEEAGEK